MQLVKKINLILRRKAYDTTVFSNRSDLVRITEEGKVLRSWRDVINKITRIDIPFSQRIKLLAHT